MKQLKQLSDLQVMVMRPLWQQGELTVAQVHEAVQGERDLALTTVATILSRLEKQGVVTHRTDKRQYIYRATVSEQEVRRSMVGDLIRHLFSGDPAALVSHLLQQSEIGAEDLAHVKALIEAHEQKEQSDGK